MRILHVGNLTLVAPLRALGHEVLVAEEAHPDLVRPGVPFDARDLWRRLPAPPDCFLVVDTLGHQALPYGLEDVPASRIYYAIDVHLNFYWQRHYAQLFDLVLVAQKDYVPLLESAGVPAHWLPAGVDTAVFRDQRLPRIYDVAFVGTVDPSTRPKRAAAVEAVARHFALTSFGTIPDERLGADEMARVFSSARIVFNEAMMGDLNFRVFEAMACGAMLVTERIGNGLLELFSPRVHLAVYTPETLVATISHYLEADDERALIAAAGMAEVHARHSLAARAAQLDRLLRGGIRRRDVGRHASLHWGTTAHLAVVRGLSEQSGAREAAEHLRRAMEHGDADAALGLAEMMAWAGRHAGALTALAEARRLEPTSVRAWLLAAEVERRLGHADEAARLLRTGIETAPHVTAATRAQASAAIDGGVESAACLHGLGLVLQESGFPFAPGFIRLVDSDLPLTAFDYFVKAVETDPRCVAAATSAAAILELMDLPDFAVQFHESVLRVSPGDDAARERLREALVKSFRWPEAEHQRRVLAAIAGDELREGNREERAKAYHEAGVALRNQGAAARASLALARAAECQPERVETIADAALACVDAGEYEEAARLLTQARRHATAAGRVAIDRLLAMIGAPAAP